MIQSSYALNRHTNMLSRCGMHLFSAACMHARTDSPSRDERGCLLGRLNLSKSNSQNSKQQHFNCSPPRAQPPRHCRPRPTGCRAKQRSGRCGSLLRLKLPSDTECGKCERNQPQTIMKCLFRFACLLSLHCLLAC